MGTGTPVEWIIAFSFRAARKKHCEYKNQKQ